MKPRQKIFNFNLKSLNFRAIFGSHRGVVLAQETTEKGIMKLLLQNPIHHQLSPDWKYIPSGRTDIRKTFKRIRDRLALEAKPKLNKVRELKRMVK